MGVLGLHFETPTLLDSIGAWLDCSEKEENPVLLVVAHLAKLQMYIFTRFVIGWPNRMCEQRFQNV